MPSPMPVDARAPTAVDAASPGGGADAVSSDGVTGTRDAPGADGPVVGSDAAGATWWQPAWSRRRAVTLAAVADEELAGGVPVLVSLAAADIDHAAAAADGADVRFVDEQGQQLAHEIEAWDRSGESTAWVLLPRLGAKTAARFWMYYGNPTAPARSAAERAATWQAAHAAVWHFAGDARDATAHHFDGQPNAGRFAPGWRGQAAVFDASKRDCVALAMPGGIGAGASGITVSMWVKHEGEVHDGQDIILGIGTTETTGHLSRVSIAVSPGLGLIGEANPDEGAWDVTSSADRTLVNGQWQLLAAVIDVPAKTITLYKNGVPLGRPFKGRWTSAAYKNAPANRVTIGCEEDRSKSFFNGAIDELRVETVARSSAYLAAQARILAGTALTVGAEQRRD
jgi:hypothetical protein